MAFPQTIARAGDDGDFIVKTDVVHFFVLSFSRSYSVSLSELTFA